MSSLSVPSREAPSSRPWSAGRPSRTEGGDSRTGSRSPLPSTPRVSSSKNSRPQGHSRPSQDKPDTIRTNSSSTTSSTSGSSFLDRMKLPSSSTSLEDNQAEAPRQGRDDWASARGKQTLHTEEHHPYGEDDVSQKDPTRLAAGHGYDLWSHVTAVASNLTVNVSQAWQKSVLADGEETPPGQESRLTKAMKAYHLDRARSPADLPAWLFDEHERGVAPKAWSTSKARDYEDRFLPDRDSAPHHGGGLRDVYDRAAASSSSTTPAARTAPAESGDGGRSRAENRLKAIRDAKRSAKTATDTAPSYSEESGGARSRVGLPPRPGRVR